MSTVPASDHEERVSFENWREEGCHVFVDHKHVLTIQTPESCLGGSAAEVCFIEDWISPVEYCDRLEAVLRGLGASAGVVSAVDRERGSYRSVSFELPRHDGEAELQAILNIAV